MENGGEPSVKKIKTEPLDEDEVSARSSPSNQRLLIDPLRVQHLQEIAKQFDSKLSKRNNSRSVQDSAKISDSSTVSKNSKTGKVSSLETIIGRLNSETSSDGKGSKSAEISAPVSSKDKDNTDSDMDRKDVGTQTAVSMVQLIKSIIRDRMKALQDSVFKDAAVDNLMNGKLLELRKENKELKECLQKLQANYDLLLNQSKSNKKQEVPRKPQPHASVDKTSSDAGKQPEGSTTTAVINPYQVQSTASQSSGFIVLQSNSRVTPSRMKPTISQSTSGVRSVSVGHSAANTNHWQGNHHRGHTQPAQGSQPSHPQHPQAQTQLQQQPPQQQHVQMLVNVQGGQVAGQAPLVNLHGPPGVVGAQPQIISGQPQMVNASGQLVNSKGQIVPPISPQIRHSAPIRYGVPQYIPQPSQANVRPSATTQVVYASQGVRVTADPRMPALPPNYEQATGSQGVHYSHSSVGPRPRMVQPPPNYVLQSPTGQRPVVPQQARKPEAIASSNTNPARSNVDSLPLPPRLQVTISAAGSGIVLSWDVEAPIPANVPSIECYHLFAHQDSEAPPRSMSNWKRIGVVKALPLPMACTLTQFVSGSSYHFAIMAVDMYGREGPMSNPCTIRLGK